MSWCACFSQSVRRVAAVAILGTVVTTAAAHTGKYLIVTPPAYAESTPLTQLKDARTATGLAVSIYNVPSGTARTAIKNYIASWYDPGQPCYVLLVGDTDGSSSGNNTLPHWTGGGSESAATDLPYACMDGVDDWHPDLFVGRFPVRTVDELRAIVAKTLFVEAGVFSDPDYVKRGAFLATSDTGALAEQTHDWVIDNYFTPADYQAIKIYANQGGGTTDITNAINSGCLWCVYFGHSSSSGWWTPSFDQPDVRALNNAGLYGLVFGFSCNTANWPTSECFGETWIRQENKGAAAYISASTYIYYGGNEWESSRRLEKYFFESFFVDDIWEVAPAWQAGQYRLIADTFFSEDVRRNMVEMFNVFGDPALLLPQPWGFGLSGVPGAQDVCIPPDTAATFAVDVTTMGGFDEVITLSAAGGPPGATYIFNINGVQPPFVSQLTVGNLAGTLEGAYEIVITGTAPSLHKEAQVWLNVANDLPASMTLVSPPDGAVDVARMPTLTWSPADGALAYHVQVAQTPSFTNPVYSGTVTTSSVMLPFNLESLTTYYWRAWATNGCGPGPYSDTYSFTTIEQPDYFTEQFNGSFDLDGFSLTFTPDGSGQYYKSCATGISLLPTDPAGGTVLALEDEDYEHVIPTANVYLYNVAYSDFYVSSNGYITFNGGDTTYNETLANHFSRPRIALLFDDLNPENGGPVSWKETVDRVAVTWEDLPEWNNTGSNTFQAELFFDGRIRLSWAGITCGDTIAGLSQGLGIPSDFLMSDLSAAQTCACPGDGNCDGFINWRDIDYFVAAVNDNEAAWAALFAPGVPSCPFANNDVNGDGTVNWRDIDFLVAVMNTTCP